MQKILLNRTRGNNKMTETKPQLCERCYTPSYTLYEDWRTDDETGEKVKWMLCRRCDWEMMNSWASEDEDLGEMMLRREEENYSDDPVNNPPPRYYR
jgi:RNase P subunit RPR2